MNQTAIARRRDVSRAAVSATIKHAFAALQKAFRTGVTESVPVRARPAAAAVRPRSAPPVAVAVSLRSAPPEAAAAPRSDPASLEKLEEADLWKRYLDSGRRDPAVRAELSRRYDNLVRSIVHKGFLTRGEPLEDLFQVGRLGLLKAIEKFDPHQGPKFSTYAVPTISGEIKRYFRDKGSVVKTPRRLQELSSVVSRAAETLGANLGREPTDDELAERLGVPVEEVRKALELRYRMAYSPVSLDGVLESPESDKSSSLMDFLADEEGGFAGVEDMDVLRRAFAALPERQRTVLYLRFYDDLKQTDIARKLGISQMHVSRLQSKALETLKAVMGKPSNRAVPGGRSAH
ncbi:MAG: SigB/SigF/SigG family RNA polymerase sigma factor [Elusimicrobia bacterium]|nr:SigB/SigF/SigG family RNA polymerase sigma factor [Elusimicrobiota bacterium]